MKIQILSDIHLEFGGYEPRLTDADLLVLAGDAGVGLMGHEWLNAHWAEQSVIYIAGNHEHYGHHFREMNEKLSRLTQGSSIHFLDHQIYDCGNIRFHGVTLWTDYNLFSTQNISARLCQEVVNDFHAIRQQGGGLALRPEDVVARHRQSLRWLTDSLKRSTAELDVVVTHHAPSPRSLPGHLLTHEVGAAYASRLEEWIEAHQPALWIHGHVHEGADYTIGRTRIVANPRGYPGEINSRFHDQFIIEL